MKLPRLVAEASWGKNRAKRVSGDFARSGGGAYRPKQDLMKAK